MAQPAEITVVTLSVEQLRALMRDAVREAHGAPATEPQARYVDLDRIVKHFGVSKSTVHNWINHEGCPHVRCGKILRFELSAVEAWFRGTEAEPSHLREAK